MARENGGAGVRWTGALAVAVFAALTAGSPFAFEVSAAQWPLVALVAGIAWAALAARGAPIALAPLDAAALALLVYALASLFWTPALGPGAVFAAKLGGVWLAVVALRSTVDESARAPIVAAIAAAAVFGIGVPFLVPDLESYVGGFGNPNFQAEFLLMALPWLIWGFVKIGHVAARVAFAAALFAVALHLVFGSQSKIVILVLVLVPTSAFVALAIARRPIMLVGLVPVLGALAFLSYERGADEFARSLSYRGEILMNALAIWFDHPVFGAGAGAFDALYPLYQERHLDLLPGSYLIRRNYLVGAAHNEFAQIAVQFGLVGLGILAWGLVAGVKSWRAARDDQAWRLAAGFSLANGAVAGLVGFPFQMPATVLLAALAVAALSVGPVRSFVTWAPAWRRIAVALALVGCAAGLYAGGRGFAAQIEMRWALQSRPVGPDLAFERHRAATEWAPWDEYLGQTLYLTYTLWQGRTDQATLGAGEPAFPFLRDPMGGPDDNEAWYRRALAHAKHSPNLRYARLEYLLNARRHARARAEIEDIFAFLNRYHSRVPETQIMEAYFALLIGDAERAQAAIDRHRRNRFAKPDDPTIGAFGGEVARLRADPARYRFVGILHLTW